MSLILSRLLEENPSYLTFAARDPQDQYLRLQVHGDVLRRPGMDWLAVATRKNDHGQFELVDMIRTITIRASDFE